MRMAGNDYRFVTHWRVQGTCIEVSDVLENVREFPRWWPSVYLDVKILRPGRLHSLGEEASLLTRGWLPYTLRWDFTVVEQRYPNGSVLEARGDFDGRGEWIIEQDGPMVNATYVWDVKAEKPLLRTLTPVLRSIFAANHDWAMRMGERSLNLELQRIHARTESERLAVPPPPGPTFHRRRAR